MQPDAFVIGRADTPSIQHLQGAHRLLAGAGVPSIQRGHTMFIDKPRHRPKKTGVDREEERAWVGFYRRVRSDPSIAAEVMGQLEADPDSKRTHLALYLCCKESLRLAKARHARNKQFGRFVRWCCHGLFVAPIHSIRNAWHASGELAAACLPEMTGSSSRVEWRRTHGQAAPSTGVATLDPSPATVAKPAKSGAVRPSMVA